MLWLDIQTIVEGNSFEVKGVKSNLFLLSEKKTATEQKKFLKN